MPKLRFFWYSKINIFACTVRKSLLWGQTDWMLCLLWYLESSKRVNNRVNSCRKLTRNCLKAYQNLKKKKKKKPLALALPGHRSSGTGKSHLVFKPFGILFLGITLPSFGSVLATWLLISGHLFVFCFIWSVVRFWFWLVLLIWFVRTDIWYKMLRLIWELLLLSFHAPPGNPLENFFKWLVHL